MKVQTERLRRNIEALGSIGSDENGVTRRSYTKEDLKAREFVIGLMRDAGLTVRQDPVGNIFGRRAGRNNEKPVVMFGSHIDSVPGGGKFDGCLGVLGGIEAINALNEAGILTESPLEVVAFSDEEGGWGSGTFGSRVLAGHVDDSEISSLLPDGQTLAFKMQSIGLNPSAYKEAIFPYKIGAYLELHIEQGGVLDAEGIDIGIVTGIVGITRGTVHITGAANHAGTTPMHMRDDALLKASRVIQFVNDEGRRGNDMVATIGKLSLLPGAVNVIPGSVTMSLEMRSMSDSRVAEALDRIRTFAASIPGVSVECGLGKPAVFMSSSVMDVIQNAAVSAGLSKKRMHSGAGHDAMIIAPYAPTGMIFVPSKNGISHSVHEWTDWDKAAQGVDVLMRAIVSLA